MFASNRNERWGLEEATQAKHEKGAVPTWGHVGGRGSEQQHLSEGDNTRGSIEGARLTLLCFLHHSQTSCVHVRATLGGDLLLGDALEQMAGYLHKQQAEDPHRQKAEDSINERPGTSTIKRQGCSQTKGRGPSH